MSASERIAAAIHAAVAKGRPALVGYLTAGFPSRRQFKQNLAAVAGGCDVDGVGIFSKSASNEARNLSFVFGQENAHKLMVTIISR